MFSWESEWTNIPEEHKLPLRNKDPCVAWFNQFAFLMQNWAILKELNARIRIKWGRQWHFECYSKNNGCIVDQKKRGENIGWNRQLKGNKMDRDWGRVYRKVMREAQSTLNPCYSKCGPLICRRTSPGRNAASQTPSTIRTCILTTLPNDWMHIKVWEERIEDTQVEW